MIKTYIHIIFLIGLQTVVLSQSKLVVESTETQRSDSLKKKLATAKDDSSRIRIMSEIGFFYEVLNADSSIKYTQAGLALAKERGYTWAEAGLMTNLGSALRQKGKLAESLDFLFNSLKIAETTNTTDQIARTYRRLADVYFDLENFPKAIEYLLKALKIDEANRHKRSTALDHMSLGTVYEKINKLDAANFHTDKAFQQKDLIKNWIQYAFQASGNIQLKKENYEAAGTLFREGFFVSEENNDFKTASDICADMSALFIKLNKKDSAIFYASKGFKYGEKASSKQGVLRSATLLAELYDSIQPLTALKYYKIAAAAKDSLFGVNNIQIIQNLIAREEAKQKELEDARVSYRNRLKLYMLVAGLAVLFIVAFILYRNNRQKQKANVLLHQQKDKIEATLKELKSTQAQLIQSEKMASLGELTAGIAHEIQNPLNFVNNFSDVNKELLGEMNEEIEKGNLEEVKAIAKDVIDNEEKINHHGKRADAIVKGMLQHSQISTGLKEPTNINKLADEYLRLAYQGLRAKNKSFNATWKTDFEESLSADEAGSGKINIIPQDIGRVLLNLYNNAFYAVNEKKQQHTENYEPAILVSTKKVSDKVEIKVTDNGNGIPQKIVDKIYQPFFTTKPTGQGTGLGLSLSYDIVKAHGGEIKVETEEGKGTSFIISLPI
jgi:two-component system, NtrC family, sensor kinase